MKIFKKPIFEKASGTGKKSKAKKIVIPVVIIMAVLAGGFVAFRSFVPRNRRAVIASTIDYRVRRGNIQSSVSAVGTIYASDSRDITGASGSTIVSVNVTEGQTVKKGDMLFKLENESLNIDLKKAEVNLSQLQSQLKTLKTQQAELPVTAPIAGIVKEVNAGVKDEIGRQQPVAVIEDTSVMKFAVPTNSLGPDASLFTSLKVGDSIPVFISEINAERTAVVTAISSDSRGINVEFKVTDKAGLSFGSYYNVTFKFSSKDVVLSSVTQFAGSTVNVTPRQAGTVTAVNVKVGDKVAKNKKLFDVKSDNIVNQIQSLEVNIEAAELEVENRQKAVDELTVKAPIDGIVFNIQAEVGDTVGSSGSGSSGSSGGSVGGSSSGSNSSGNALATLENRDALKVEIPVDELDIGKVQIGQEAQVKVDAFPDKVYKGKVTTISPQGTVSNGSATFDVVVTVEEPEGLKSGMSSTVAIVTSAAENALLVPIEAIMDFNGKKFVLVKNDTKTVRTEVTIGVVNTDSAEVLTGLKEGDTIVMQSQSGTNTGNTNIRIPGMGGMMGGGEFRQNNGGNTIIRQPGSNQQRRQGQ